MKKLIIAVGTRPELIKVACIVKELECRGLREHCILINTAQHKELLEPYWKMFDIRPDISFDVMRKGQDLSILTARVLEQFQRYLDGAKGEIAGVLAQGDTTTVLGVSLVCFYNRIVLFHLEAGLRSFDLYNPFPEEFNRKVSSIIASYHLCPTEEAKTNLLKEGIDQNKIFVVGNTVIDAVLLIKKHVDTLSEYENIVLNQHQFAGKKIVIITCHRRENHGENLISIIDAVYELATENADIQFVWILHPNPQIINVIPNSKIAGVSNVLLIDPVSYTDLVKLLSNAIMAISDSGGIQEEAPSFNVPVLVLRKTTERPEGIDVGAAVLVGSDKRLIKNKFYEYLENGIDIKVNPYGDGLSSARVVNHLLQLL